MQEIGKHGTLALNLEEIIMNHQFGRQDNDSTNL
jgi:hypothetical protein